MQLALLAMYASVALGQPVANMENEALASVVRDLQSIHHDDQRYMRYVWITNGDLESFQAVRLTVNFIGQKQLLHRPTPVTNGKVLLARVDLQKLASGDKLHKLIKDWEEFQYDPRFSLLLTKDTIRFAVGLGVELKKRKERKLETVPEYVQDGQKYNQKWVEHEVAINLDNENVVRIIGEHLDKALIAECIDKTHSQAPIVTHEYFIFRALSTIKDKGLYATLFGGMYYDLADIPQNSKKGSDEDNLLEQLGVGSVANGITAKDVFSKLGSDQRVAMFKSGVTGSTRQIEYLRTVAGRDTQGLAVFTRDIKRQGIDIGQHAIMNLLRFQHDGSEVIFEKVNGLQGFVAMDGKGKVVQSVPSDIAVDRTVPAPHSTDLQAAIGCIRCHGSEGGWRIAKNDVKKLVGGSFDILNDRNFFQQKRYNKDDVFERLAGLYSGDLELKLLPRARDDYASAVLQASGPWKGGRGDQTDIVKLASAKLSKIYADFWYTSVDARRVLMDLNIKVDDKDAARILTEMLPPVAVGNDEYIEEDPRIEALKKDVPINPTDYVLTYSFIARRAQLGGKR